MEDDEIRRLQEARRLKAGELQAFGRAADDEDGAGRDQYVGSIDLGRDDGDEDDDQGPGARRRPETFTAPRELLEALPGAEPAGDVFDEYREKTIAEKESEYQKRRHNRQVRAPLVLRFRSHSAQLSPERMDAFAQGTQKGRRTFKEAMEEVNLEREEKEVQLAVEKKLEAAKQELKPSGKRSRRWDVAPAAATAAAAEAADGGSAAVKSEPKGDVDLDDLEEDVKKRTKSQWDDEEDKRKVAGATPQKRASRWDQTPVLGAKATRTRWDETPMVGSGAMALGATPLVGTLGLGATPIIPAGPGGMFRAQAELEWRNRPLTDTELDSLLPSEGYKVVDPPASYKPIRTPARKLNTTPSPFIGASSGFEVAEAGVSAASFGMIGEIEGLPIRPEDRQFFSKIIDGRTEEDAANAEEAKEIRIMRLLLAIKNGTPPMRKRAFRTISEQARLFGAGPLFAQILPLLMSSTLEENERHLLVKTIDRVLYRLDDLVRPYVHKILVVIEPLLIDESFIARAEGREIISNLAKAAGLATMIAVMRPDVDHPDEYARNTTARAFAVVASALGIPALLPFLKAVCRSKKSWQARHTGVKIIQQLAMLVGCAVLPHLKMLVDCVAYPGGGLQDEQQKVRTVTALALAALAEASAPYGIEAFDAVLKDLYYGIRKHRGKGLAAFLKAIGFMLPLMDASIASFYVREVMVILIREFASPDDEMKRIVLRVVQQAVGAEGVTPAYVRDEILPEYFRNFWTRRMALEKRNYQEVVSCTVEIANRVGGAEVLSRVADSLKDESEPFRKMVAECVDKVVANLGTADVSPDLEKRLIDGMIFAFQEQLGDDSRVLVDSFGRLVNSLGTRMKPYLPQLAGVLKFRLNNKMAKIRQHAALLIGRIAEVMVKVASALPPPRLCALFADRRHPLQCDEEKLLGHLSVVLYEYLGEEYPDVLASILTALKAVVNVMGMEGMQPPVRDLLPRLTPILRNRHESVQENVVELVGRIADRGGEFVVAKEWMRICYELLDLLKAHRKNIRKASVNAFGYIAKAIGPADVLVTLLNNLKVQERQNRVCTTVAIAIVAEQCSPFTVLPGLMNEYKIPDMNVQNGVLKAMSFMFEYIGPMASDYINAVTPLLEDALIDRDAVHRQTAASVVKHIALGVKVCVACLLRVFCFFLSLSAAERRVWAARTAWCTCSTTCGPTCSRRART